MNDSVFFYLKILGLSIFLIGVLYRKKTWSKSVRIFGIVVLVGFIAYDAAQGLVEGFNGHVTDRIE